MNGMGWMTTNKSGGRNIKNKKTGVSFVIQEPRNQTNIETTLGEESVSDK